MGWGPDMAEARTYYDYEYSKGLTWRFRKRLGRASENSMRYPKNCRPNCSRWLGN
jgi:hypothetical protein